MQGDSKLYWLYKTAFYKLVRCICRLAAILLFNFRTEGQQHMPAKGPVVILSNHQSVLDPVLIGISFERHLDYLAKASLFKVILLGSIISWLDAIPIDRDRGGLSGLRAMLARLKADRAVLIFPEGTRSKSGQLLSMKGGFLPVARRSRSTLLPAAIVGASDVMRSDRRLPQRSKIAAVIGEPILAEDYIDLKDADVVQLVQQRIADCYEKAGRLRKL